MSQKKQNKQPVLVLSNTLNHKVGDVLLEYHSIDGKNILDDKLNLLNANEYIVMDEEVFGNSLNILTESSSLSKSDVEKIIKDIIKKMMWKLYTRSSFFLQ